MKKLFITFFLILTSFISNAQCWITSQTKADPLLETEDITREIYEAKECIFWISDNKELYVLLKSGAGLFETETLGSIQIGKFIAAGIYNEKGVLIEKISNCALIVSDDYKTAGFEGLNQQKKIINHLKQSKGYVRIIIERFRREDLDVIIPCKSSCTK